MGIVFIHICNIAPVLYTLQEVAYIMIYRIIYVRSSKSKNIVASTVIIDYANILVYIFTCHVKVKCVKFVPWLDLVVETLKRHRHLERPLGI